MHRNPDEDRERRCGERGCIANSTVDYDAAATACSRDLSNDFADQRTSGISPHVAKDPRRINCCSFEVRNGGSWFSWHQVNQSVTWTWDEQQN